MKEIFIERYKKLGQEIVPEEIELSKTIRVNTLKIAENELIERLSKEGVGLMKVPFLDFGYSVESSNFSVGAAPEALQGYYYVQEAAAQVPVQILNPKEGETVLDMSAAPGGKTTQMAQYMKNKGTIIAIDSNSSRLTSLKNNLERLGVKNTIVYQKDAEFVSDLNMEFDKVLLDAPCSGNFCIDKDWFEKRTIDNLKQVSKIQKKLFASAVTVLKKGGELVYSTCSLEPEEDELVVDWALKEFPELKMQKIDLNSGDDGLTEVFGQKLNEKVKLAKRFWPNKTKTQGFFIAKFKKEK